MTQERKLPIQFRPARWRIHDGHSVASSDLRKVETEKDVLAAAACQSLIAAAYTALLASCY
jgi:hypothetical protein